jgi:quercetin dioxygenase-like cupin family protein
MLSPDNNPKEDSMPRVKTSLHLPAAAPAELVALTDYQEGSIVSRTLLQDEAGTLTVFSLDKGQGLSEHTVPFDAFVQVLDGEAEIAIGGRPVRVRAGEIMLMPGGVSHQVQAVERFKMLLILFRTRAEESASV